MIAAPESNFDALDFEDVETGECRVKNPLTGAPSAWVITLAGPEQSGRKKRLQARQRRMRAIMAKTGKYQPSDPEEDAAEQITELVACTLGWTGYKEAYSPEAARKLYSDPKRRWLCDQVQAALDERELFMRASGQT